MRCRSFFRAFLISRKADNHEARGIRLIRIAWSEIHKRKFSEVSTIFFSRGDSFKGQWYRLESYSKDRKGTLRDGRYIIIPLEANEAMKHADHSDVDDASRRVASSRVVTFVIVAVERRSRFHAAREGRPVYDS